MIETVVVVVVERNMLMHKGLLILSSVFVLINVGCKDSSKRTGGATVEKQALSEYAYCSADQMRGLSTAQLEQIYGAVGDEPTPVVPGTNPNNPGNHVPTNPPTQNPNDPYNPVPTGPGPEPIYPPGGGGPCIPPPTYPGYPPITPGPGPGQVPVGCTGGMPCTTQPPVGGCATSTPCQTQPSCDCSCDSGGGGWFDWLRGGSSSCD